MTNLSEKSLCGNFPKIAACLGFLLLFGRSPAFAAVNFMLDENGKIIQMSTFSMGKRIALNKGFPLEDSNRGLRLTNYATGETIAEFKPKKDKTAGLVWSAYALDTERIVLGFGAHVGIWNRKTNTFALHRSKGSGESGHGHQTSGVHPDEQRIISCHPSSPWRQGLFLHDLKSGATTTLFNQYEVVSPRFSPDGSRYAFYGRLNRHKSDEESFLIIQDLSSEERRVYRFSGGLYGVNLSWSPSGKYLAGICSSLKGDRPLCVWNRSGELIAQIPLSFMTRSDWSPLWMQDEKSISLFSRKHFEKNDDKILRYGISLREYGL